MCTIAGFCNFNIDFESNTPYFNHVLTTMRQNHGADGQYLSNHIGFSCKHLSKGSKFAIVYNGTLYNAGDLKQELRKTGVVFETKSETEIILNAFIHYGPSFVEKLNGVFAFAIWNGQSLFLYRDHVGAKPLFYTVKDSTLVFASELKTLFGHPDIRPAIDNNSLREIFGLGPARTPGCGVFKDVYEVLPGHYLVFSGNELKPVRYWALESRPHKHNCEETVETVSRLVTDAIKRQMISNTPVCTLLSGGVDSSIVTAVASNHLQESGRTLNTFSFDFKGNDEFFTANTFQPERDRPFVDKMRKIYPLNHTYLECAEEDLVDLLDDVVHTKGLPGMADIDASLLYFCKLVKQHNSVALTGECADEIFGGYPWFYREELMQTNTFPWSKDMQTRKALLSPELLETLQLDEYVQSRYEDSLKQVPCLAGETPQEARRREIAYLNIMWFMQTLLTRMDRASVAVGLEARAPFADRRIMEYLWNVPWEMKCHNGVVKGLLREAFRALLPPELLSRKKSPFPKTYNPNYTHLLQQRLLAILDNASSPLLPLIDREKMHRFALGTQTLDNPWFGQLMAGPQLMAYFIQVDTWLRMYA